MRRRTVLGSALAGLAVAGCRADQPQTRDHGRRRHDRFPGDPGRGRLYLGATVPAREPVLGSLLFTLEGLTMSRRFYRPHQLDSLYAAVVADAAAGVLSLVSCKAPAPWARMTSGPGRAWLDRMLMHLDDAGAEIWLALHHEPENDPAAGDARDWVAMQQHLIERAAVLAPRITVVPVLMQWTFTRESTRDVVPDLPLVAAEVGCRPDPSDPLRAPNWLRNAFQYSVLHDVVALAYFDAPHQGDLTLRLDADRWDAWSVLARRREVARPARARTAS